MYRENPIPVNYSKLQDKEVLWRVNALLLYLNNIIALSVDKETCELSWMERFVAEKNKCSKQWSQRTNSV